MRRAGLYFIVAAVAIMVAAVACGGSTPTRKSVSVQPTKVVTRATARPTDTLEPTPAPKPIKNVPGVPHFPQITFMGSFSEHDLSCADGAPMTHYEVYYKVSNITSREIAQYYVDELVALGWHRYVPPSNVKIGETLAEWGYNDYVEEFWRDEHGRGGFDGACYTIEIEVGSKGIHITARVP